MPSKVHPVDVSRKAYPASLGQTGNRSFAEARINSIVIPTPSVVAKCRVSTLGNCFFFFLKSRHSKLNTVLLESQHSRIYKTASLPSKLFFLLALHSALETRNSILETQYCPPRNSILNTVLLGTRHSKLNCPPRHSALETRN